MASGRLDTLAALQSSSSGIKSELIDEEHQLSECMKELNQHSELSVDCEGVDLGRDGELCLVQVATPHKVYLFDIVTLGRKVFDSGLKAILESERIVKLFYDCREDCNSLLHSFGVRVQGIIDVQLLNTVQMKVQGKRWQCVSGLQKCMSYHLPGCGFSAAAKTLMHKAFDSDKKLWKNRPLKKEYIAYAATDVFYLSRLKERIVSKVTHHNMPKDALIELVKYSSTRYADFMRDNSGYAEGSQYFGTARLPERIIPDVEIRRDYWDIKRFEPLTGRACRSCHWAGAANLDGQCKRCRLIDSETS